MTSINVSINVSIFEYKIMKIKFFVKHYQQESNKITRISINMTNYGEL